MPQARVIRMSGGPHSRTRKPRQQQADAEALAIAALAFLTAEPARFARFLDLTGIAVNSIRAAAREPGFLAGVLDHLSAEESMLLEFAAGQEIDPTDVLAARDVLAHAPREGEPP
jgi:Protein of unknown function (DUF3572)